jgi:hypothetical protein
MGDFMTKFLSVVRMSGGHANADHAASYHSAYTFVKQIVRQRLLFDQTYDRLAYHILRITRFWVVFIPFGAICTDPPITHKENYEDRSYDQFESSQ